MTVVFATSKNAGPSWGMDPVTLLYLGTSEQAAINEVGDFRKYEKPLENFPTNFPESYSAIPRDLKREVVKWYMADGWWYSVVMFHL